LLEHVWKGYDHLRSSTFSVTCVNQEDEDIERDVTELLEPAIRTGMSGFEPFYIQHNPYEHETRQPAPAQPPQYDLAFVWSAQPRLKWPLEAKVLRSDESTSEYITAITTNFLTCRYAPFSSEAAMLGYLLQGLPDRAFTKIAKELSCTLKHHASFVGRDHKTSDHHRDVPGGKDYPREFRCHHMILVIGQGN
jgi:hypothetical protein